MRLAELYKPKEITDFRKKFLGRNWRGIADELLQKHGFHHQGGGFYATVSTNEKYPYALKIFRNDDGYIEWFKFSKANQDNPFVPQFRGKITRLIKNSSIYAIRIEKLSHIDNRYSISVDGIEDSGLDENKLLIKYAYNYDLYGRNIKNLKSSGNKYVDQISAEFKRYRESGGGLDIHGGNIMKRKNGHLVITDPYTS